MSPVLSYFRFTLLNKRHASLRHFPTNWFAYPVPFPSPRRYIDEGRESKRQQGSRERSHNHRQYRVGGRRRNATSPAHVFRGPLCAIDYRCPSYLAVEARSFLREHAIFCSLVALSRAHPHSFTGGGGGRPAVGTRRFKLFALWGSPMILAIILNSEESARKGGGVATWIAALSPLATAKGGRSASFRLHEGRRFRRFLRWWARFSSRDERFVVVERQVLNFFFF